MHYFGAIIFFLNESVKLELELITMLTPNHISSLSFYLTEFSSERCAAPNLNADTVLATFARTCYEFHVTRGESYEKAQQICKSHGK